MKCGLKFELRDHESQIFTQLLSCVQHDGKWVVDCTWIEEVSPKQPSSLKEGIFTFEELINMLSCENNILFFRIRHFDSLSTISQTRNYMDYMESQCCFILICEDVRGCIVYSKAEDELYAVYEIVRKSNLCINVEFIDDDTFTDVNLIPI